MTPTKPKKAKARRMNSRRSLEPRRWNQAHLLAIGAELSFQCDFPSSDPPQELLVAVLNTVDAAEDDYWDLFPTSDLRRVADVARWLSYLNPTLPHIEDERRHHLCARFVDFIICCLCPCYSPCDLYNGYMLRLHCGEVAVSWEPLGYVGAHVWIVMPQNPLPDFAEETAFAVSIAQEFGMNPSEEEFEVWLVSVRKDRAAVVHVTISRAFLQAADQSTTLRPGVKIGELGYVKVQAGKEFRLMDVEKRTQFVGILNGVAKWANSRVVGDFNLEPASWK